MHVWACPHDRAQRHSRRAAGVVPNPRTSPAVGLAPSGLRQIMYRQANPYLIFR